MPVREFTSPDGRRWTAWNVVPGQHVTHAARSIAHLPPELEGGWLCFECSAEKRRLVPVPEGWDEMDDAGLTGLCERAAHAPPVRRTLLIRAATGGDAADAD
jgi:hypothetical protein